MTTFMPEDTNTIMHIFKRKLELMPRKDYPLKELEALEKWAEEIAREFAEAEVQRFAQHLKDQGFSPDLAFSNHVQDCYLDFRNEQPQ